MWLCHVPICTTYLLEIYLSDTTGPFSLGIYSLCSGQAGDQTVFRSQAFLGRTPRPMEKHRHHGKASEKLLCQPALKVLPPMIEKWAKEPSRINFPT